MRARDPLQRCWVCGARLVVCITHSRRGRYALGFRCSVDGRHLRGFINDPQFLSLVMGGTRPTDVSPETLRNRVEAVLARRPGEQSTAP